MNKYLGKFLLLVALSFTMTYCSSDLEEGANVNGNIKGADGKLAFLEDVNGKFPVAIDTFLIEGGKLKLNAVTDPGLYRIRFDGVASKSPVLLFLDNASNIKLSYDTEKPDAYTASGNKESVAINKALANQADFFSRVEAARASLTGAGSGVKADSINKAIQDLYASGNESVKALINENQNLDPHVNALLLNLLNPQTDSEFIIAELKKCIDKNGEAKFIKGMGQRFGLVEGGQQPQQQAPQNAGIAIGSQAPNIAQKNFDDEIVELASLKGKYVLVDFWASWCKPCRKENPNVVKTYNKYKDNGFEIYSVSLDKSKERWADAVIQDGLIWDYHVSDLKAWSSEAARKYGVRSIPATFLLDPEGNVIAKNLRGPALEQKLAEVLGTI